MRRIYLPADLFGRPLNAVRVERFARLGNAWLRAALRAHGMVESKRVYGSVHYVWIVANVFHDVDLSVIGPVGLPLRIVRGEHPNGRPRATPGRQPYVQSPLPLVTKRAEV